MEFLKILLDKIKWQQILTLVILYMIFKIFNGVIFGNISETGKGFATSIVEVFKNGFLLLIGFWFGAAVKEAMMKKEQAAGTTTADISAVITNTPPPAQPSAPDGLMPPSTTLDQMPKTSDHAN